jgi:molybdopterin converting factor small subunit
MLRKKRQELVDRGAIETTASSVGKLLEELELSGEEAAIVFVNDKRAGLHSAIQDGDYIRIFPMLGGG